MQTFKKVGRGFRCDPFAVFLYFWSIILLLEFPSVSFAIANDTSINECTCHDQEVSSSLGLRIFYLVLVHNQRTLEDAVHLFRAIRHPSNIILIHIDRKAQHLLSSPNNLLRQEIETCSCGSQVRLESVYDVRWSQWSMNLPTLWGITVAVNQYKGEWDVWINLSGDTLPVYTPVKTATILSQLPYNFVTSSSCETGLLPTNLYHFPSWWHKRRHYTRDGTEDDWEVEYTDAEQSHTQRTTMVTYFGSQWVILQRDFCEWFVKERAHNNSLPMVLERYFETSGKLMTDETYLPTLLLHSFPQSLPQIDESSEMLLWKNGTVSQISAIRYERMDEHVPTAFAYFWKHQRYDVSDKSLADRPKPWGPYYLGVYDLYNIRASGALFVRKVTEQIDPNMVQLFPVQNPNEIPPIRWPDHEIKVTPLPDWEHWIADMKQQFVSSDDDYEEDEL